MGLLLLEHKPLNRPRIHILKAPPCEKKSQQRALEMLNKNEKRRLKRYCCSFCDQPLDMAGCGVFYGPTCPEETRLQRMKACLDDYKPRSR